MVGVVWRTSSRSSGNGECVEVGWTTSSRSAGGGACVEVGWTTSSRTSQCGNCVETLLADPVLVRDSKDRGGPVLAFGRTGWAGFVAAVKEGAYDL